MENVPWTLVWAVISTVTSFLFGWGYWSLRKEFVTKKQYDEDRSAQQKNWLNEFTRIDKRVQSIEQTYAEKNTVTEISKNVTKLQTELHKDMIHLKDTLVRIERPLNLIVEAKLNGN